MPQATAHRWIVSQIGSLRHYATPRAFQHQGMLRWFYTDAWAGSFGARLASLHHKTRSMAVRFAPDIPEEKVIAFNLATIGQSIRERVNAKMHPGESGYLRWMRQAQSFACRVNRHLLRQQLLPGADVFYGYMSASLETLVELKNRGIFTLLDQRDPGLMEEQIVLAEQEKWPGWDIYPRKIPDVYHQRCEQEWALASAVVVHSNWTSTALIKRGVDPAKIINIPLVYEADSPVVQRAQPSDHPLVILWVGTVSLRKGIQYLIQAARELTNRRLKIIVAGDIEINTSFVAQAPPNMTFIGRVFRDQLPQLYRSADVFVIPTLSDGFALTQVEAMAHGLPVIATDRCGEVVTHQRDGLIIPAGDSAGLAQAIALLDDNRSLLVEMATAAVEKSKQFTLARHAQQLDDEVHRRQSVL